jgi:hypothetical protein
MDQYFIDCRKASLRGVEIYRVFVIKNKQDLAREVLQKQIELDLAAGIKVQFINADVFNTLGVDEDFGLWDEDYVCTIRRDANGKELEIFLDSRGETIAKAHESRQNILNNSVAIKSLQDVYNWN